MEVQIFLIQTVLAVERNLCPGNVESQLSKSDQAVVENEVPLELRDAATRFHIFRLALCLAA